MRDNGIAPIKSKTGKTRRRKVLDLKPRESVTMIARLPIKAKPSKGGDTEFGI